MPRTRMDLQAFIGNLRDEEDADVLREGVRVLAQALMEADVSTTSALNSTKGAKDDARTATATGPGPGRPGRDHPAPDPQGFPGHLRPLAPGARRRWVRALAVLVQEAYVKGVSTRRVDDLVRALGVEGISGYAELAASQLVPGPFRASLLELPQYAGRFNLACSPSP